MANGDPTTLAINVGIAFRESVRLREALEQIATCAEWSLAGEDPYDWRKGLEIVRDTVKRALESALCSVCRIREQVAGYSGKCSECWHEEAIDGP